MTCYCSLLIAGGANPWQKLLTKQVEIEKLKLYFVIPKTISVIRYPYNFSGSYPLSLKLFCQLSLPYP